MTSGEAQPSQSAGELQIRRYGESFENGGSLEGARIKLPDGRDVILERYKDDRRIVLLWPTTHKARNFFDKTTATLGLEYSDIEVTDVGTVPKAEVDETVQDYGVARVTMPENLGALAWQDFGRKGNYEAGVVVYDLDNLPLSNLMEATGSEVVMANLDEIVSKVGAELLS